MKKLIVCVLLSIMLLGCGEKDKTKPGTAWLCVLENKTTGVAEAAWASRVKPSVHLYSDQLDDIYGYDDDETKIYEKRDVDLGNGKGGEGTHSFSYRVLDIRKINALYPKYVDSWIGITPKGVKIGIETQKNAVDPKIALDKKNEIKPSIQPKTTDQLTKKVKTDVVTLPSNSPLKYTYDKLLHFFVSFP